MAKCKECGKAFKKERSTQLFCKDRGDRCRLDFYNKQRSNNRKERAINASGKCFTCGGEVERTKTGHPKKFCDDNRCRQDYYYKIRSEKKALEDAVEVTCKCCKTKFMGKKYMRFCQDKDCSMWYYNNKRRIEAGTLDPVTRKAIGRPAKRGRPAGVKIPGGYNSKYKKKAEVKPEIKIVEKKVEPIDFKCEPVAPITRKKLTNKEKLAKSMAGKRGGSVEQGSKEQKMIDKFIKKNGVTVIEPKFAAYAPYEGELASTSYLEGGY